MKWTFVDILFLNLLIILSFSEIPNNREILIRSCNLVLGMLTHNHVSLGSPEFEYQSIEDGHHKDESTPHNVCHDSTSIPEAPLQTDSSVGYWVEILHVIAVGEGNYEYITTFTYLANYLSASLTWTAPSGRGTWGGHSGSLGWGTQQPPGPSLLQTCFRSRIGVLQGCYKSVTGVFKECQRMC